MLQPHGTFYLIFDDLIRLFGFLFVVTASRHTCTILVAVRVRKTLHAILDDSHVDGRRVRDVSGSDRRVCERLIRVASFGALKKRRVG